MANKFLQLTIQSKIYFLLVVTGLLILITSLTYNTHKQTQLGEQLIARELSTLADNYFDSVNTMMLTGTMANRKLISDKLISQDEIVEARIIRGDKVKALYGKGFDNQSPKDKLDTQALAGQTQLTFDNIDDHRVMTVVKPIIASADYRGTNCLGCHQAKEGDILGAVRLSYSLEEIDNTIHENSILALVIQLFVFALAFSVLGILFRKLVTKRLKHLSDTISAIEANTDLTRKIDFMVEDEIGTVAHAFNKMVDKFRHSLQAVSQTASVLIGSSEQIFVIADTTESAVLKQKQGTDSVATAVNELEASSAEVKQTTHYASERSDTTSQVATAGIQVADGAKESIHQIRHEIETSSSVIARLNQRTNEVGHVLEVISNIAEQTNLLALNAAIEAARAGEAGRGFAVVADEIRTLAIRTHDSTDEIKKTIEQLQSDAHEAVDAMDASSQVAESRAQQVQEVGETLKNIANHIHEINELNIQIATAAEQQNYAAEEINQNVVNIRDTAEQSLTDAEEGKNISQKLVKLARDLDEQVRIFKIE